MIKVSVAIGTWNRVGMVRQAINAALNQTLKPYEIVVFDDASPDNTYGILSEEFKGHPIVKILKQPVNTGGVPNWNAAINACSGDYIAWCSDDDRWFAWHLEKSIDFMLKHPNVGMVHSGYCTSFEPTKESHDLFNKIDEEIFDKIDFEKLRSETPIFTEKNDILKYYVKYYNWPFHPSTLVFTREVWNVVGEFDPKYELADTDWFLKVACNFTVAYVPSYGVLNRRHPNNWSNEMGGAKMQKEQIRMVDELLKDYPKTLSNSILKLRWRFLFNQLLLRMYISRARAGNFNAASDIFMVLRQISWLKVFSLETAGSIEKRLTKVINSAQRLIFKNNNKYDDLGKFTPD